MSIRYCLWNSRPDKNFNKECTPPLEPRSSIPISQLGTGLYPKKCPRLRLRYFLGTPGELRIRECEPKHA